MNKALSKRQSTSNMESVRLDEDRNENTRLYQTYSGILMLNEQIIDNEYEDNLDYSNSFTEYLDK